MLAIEGQNLEKVIAGELLFKARKLALNAGDRLGIVGHNGAGKTTLLKMLAGIDSDYSGVIQISQSLAYLPQMKDLSRQSGGEQAMSLLRGTLAQNAAILLLDEPTANLDWDHRQAVIKMLQSYRGTVVCVSHDRHFLNQVVNQIWAFEEKTIRPFVGNYSAYQQTKQKEKEQAERAYWNYRQKVTSLEKEVEIRKERANRMKRKKKGLSFSEFKQNSFDEKEKTLARSAKALERRLDRLEEVDRPEVERTYRFKAVGALAQKETTLVHLREGSLTIDGRHLFSLRDFKLKSGEKIAIVGPNQAGKTTFLREVLHQNLPGYYSSDLSIGYFSQNFDQLDPSASLLENVTRQSLQSEDLIRRVLGSLGFGGVKVDQVTSSLSGGEQVRLLLAKVLLGDHNVLFLDEPTNFLDLVTMESVEKFLSVYPGAVLLVSHDQDFVQKVAEKTYRIQKGRLQLLEEQEIVPDRTEAELDRLRFQLDMRLMDPSVDLDEIKTLQQKIQNRLGR